MARGAEIGKDGDPIGILPGAPLLMKSRPWSKYWPKAVSRAVPPKALGVLSSTPSPSLS
ncbi:hypothetical protein D3C81_2190330 [compost metagenome]